MKDRYHDYLNIIFFRKILYFIYVSGEGILNQNFENDTIYR